MYVGLSSEFGCTLSVKVTMPKEDMKDKASFKEGINEPKTKSSLIKEK